MKIAVLGGGTAGFVAAAHLTQKIPQAELLHIHDTRIPAIGVGEGTTPRFPEWLEEIAGLRFPDMAERCGATLKRGTRFDGWGRDGAAFMNRFQPNRRFGYHFDASKVVKVLAESVSARHIDARVTEVTSAETLADVHLEGGAALRCDYVLDARGFPRNANSGVGEDGAELIRLDWIPTGRAMLRRLPKGRLEGATRAAARPHGWIFQIPLSETTSCGYLYNPEMTSDEEVAADFTAFLNEEGVSGWTDRGLLSFPNFLRRELFDGRVFRVGNAASFIEPLEATSICSAILQVRAAQRWIEEHDAGTPAHQAEVAAFNRGMRDYTLRNSIFIAWHYARGARWDTAFWRHAERGLERCRADPDAAPLLAEMKRFIDAGRDLPGRVISNHEDEQGWGREIHPLMKLYEPYGNFSELNFAQVGHGIGYYDADRRAGSAPLASAAR